MTKTLVLIHTVQPLISVFNELCRQILSDVRVLHILDEPLLMRVKKEKDFSSETLKTLQGHADSSVQAGADVILCTCSTLSPGLNRITSSVPLLKIDEEMIKEAVSSACVIGVIATSQSTIYPTVSSLEFESARRGISLMIKSVFVENALPALIDGDNETHDELVINAIEKLFYEVDAIVLAQASIARVLQKLPLEKLTKPILSSPVSALKKIKKIIDEMESENK